MVYLCKSNKQTKKKVLVQIDIKITVKIKKQVDETL